ncbi:PucR family transcriptional regulator ligand-binding domain-containing protein [Humibacter ginsengisoli]
MPGPTVRVLLNHRELGLRLLTPAARLPGGALDADVSWVHSSDLTDPTPFVIPGQVLLTTGTQFAGDDYNGYVDRLVAAGVAALGFGTDVVRATPEGLPESCLRVGLPLFEVPYRTPFIAVARYAADLVAEQTYARNTWALSAQRAVSLAALRADGLSATLAELSRQLGRWVALVNSDGVIDRVFPARALAASARTSVEAEAARMLRARRRAASTIVEDTTVVSLQTIGASDRLLGVLAHGGDDEVDQAAQQVVTGVVALAGLALEQGRALTSAQAAMRGNLLRALEDARSLGLELGDSSGLSGAEVAALERSASRVAAKRRAVTASSQAYAPAPARATEPGGGQEGGGQEAGGDLLAALDGADARARASALLAPLSARDPDGVLAASLLTWLEHNGVYDAAARTLGVHRHTLTARIRAAEQALGRDFGSFADRAGVWAALRVSVAVNG